MGGFSDYREYDGLGLAALLRERAVSPRELLETAIEWTERVNPSINALSQKLYDHGREALKASLPDGPFSGVPFLLKDIGAGLAGTVTTQGSRFFADVRATSDSTLTERYKRAGFVIFGKTTTPELALAPSTEGSFSGATHNPWDLSRTAGGSSGGAAAAVAAGIVPLAHASDGGGSIRIPASCCGLFGLKPTRARISAGPLAGEGWGSLSANHVVSRSVRDSAAVLDATHGPAPGDPYCAPHSDHPFLSDVGAPVRRLRIAFQRKPLSGVPVAADCAEAAEQAARLIETLGHEIEEAQPPGDAGELSHALWVLVASNVSRSLKKRAQALGRPLVQEDVDPVTWDAVEFASTLDIEDYPEALATIHMQGRRMADFHRRFDMVMSPTLAQTPLPLGILRTDAPDVAAYGRALAQFMPFTQLFNISGQPSMSVPLHWTSKNLPVGVMFSAPFGDEATLFRLAAQLEAAKPWFDRVPGVAS
jgi:Asp-tRNA(Asn)/Glu-tRNA(Gln) amidotransferase A subunit family amidase